MSGQLTKDTKIGGEEALFTPPVRSAAGHLRRDIGKVCAGEAGKATAVFLRRADGREPETYRLHYDAAADRLLLDAGDDLGFVYGLYEISRRFLGILPFWFWNDQRIVPQAACAVPADFDHQTKPSRVRYRGWFINDEVLLDHWQVERDPDKAWEMAFEALLRLGGNLTIPGTDGNSRRYRGLASSMGLYITHHHAEPLGAEMFVRACPGLTPSYAEHPDLFRKLWREGIEEQKEDRVIWNIGFRGQGDRPFWADDPRYDTPAARGKLMGDIIREQYEMVREADPDAVCCTNLYGETMELYRGGHLALPADVIRIWADNGYGKMVSRRQNDHDPRIDALPAEEDRGRHGIYYHVSFYDLQAANHLTMLPNSPAFVRRELMEVLARGAGDYWIINCSNIKPHIYYLDLLAGLWSDGDIDVEAHRREYAEAYYGAENAKAVAELLAGWPEAAAVYGPHEDSHAGEQFANHVSRMLMTRFLTDRTAPAPGLLWATKADTYEGQIRWYQSIVDPAAVRYRDYLSRCERAAVSMTEPGRALFADSLMLQARLLCESYRGASLVCQSLLAGLDGDYQRAFYAAGLAREAFLAGDAAMREREHGKWHGFYANDCETDVKQSAWVAEYLMGTLRALGDGPHYYAWQREFQDSAGDRQVFLLLNTSNHLRDQELFALMKERWED